LLRIWVNYIELAEIANTVTYSKFYFSKINFDAVIP